MSTISDATYNALPVSQRAAWPYRMSDGRWSSDAPIQPGTEKPTPAAAAPAGPTSAPSSPSMTSLYNVASGGGGSSSSLQDDINSRARVAMSPTSQATTNLIDPYADEKARVQRENDEQRRQSELAAASAQKITDEQRRIQQIPQVLSAAGVSGGAASQPAVSYPDDSAARAATFARAKDSAASIARSSLTALRDAMAERGANVAGGDNPALAAGETSVINKAQGTMGDLERAQAESDLATGRHVADMTYQGNITQRAQNLGLSQSLLQLVLNAGGAY